MTITSNAVRVLAPDGTVLSGTCEDGGRRHVVVAPVSGLVDGQGYTVRWRVIGEDGHSPAGVFTFGVGIAAPQPTDAVGASGTTWRDDVARWALFGALALLIGPLVVRLLVLRGTVPRRAREAFHLVSVVAAFLVIDVGIAGFVLRASNALQLPIADLPYGDLQPFAEKTRFGIAFLVMTIGFGVIAALLLVGWVFDRLDLRWPALAIAARPRVRALALGASGDRAERDAGCRSWRTGSTSSPRRSGSAESRRSRSSCGRSRRPFVEPRSSDSPGSRSALVAVMVLAGGYLALVRLPEPSDLWETLYGRLLLMKVGIVALALVWGAVHHFVVRPRLEADEELDVQPSLVGEAIVAFSVLLAAAILTNVAPPPVDSTAPATASTRSTR